MKALITGASGGMGADFAKQLSDMGWDLILVARTESKLTELKNSLKTNVRTITLDLSKSDSCMALYLMTKDEDIDLLINNAGFGIFGEFSQTSLEEELNMINLNVKAYHILTKQFLKDFVKKNSGRILNVASIAAFEAGPLMSTYYCTKSYVYNLSVAIYEELRKSKSKVKISVLCPGPTETGFFDRANVTFSIKPMQSEEVVKYALDQMFKNKLTIIPGFSNKLSVFATRFFSRKFIAKVCYKIQKAKDKKKNKIKVVK